MTAPTKKELFINDLYKSADSIFNNSSLPPEDKELVYGKIKFLKESESENEFELNSMIEEIFTLINMFSFKAMYMGICQLNQLSQKDDNVPAELKSKMQEMEDTLKNVVSGLQNKDFELYESNISKIGEISAEIEVLKAEIDKKLNINQD